MLSSELDPTHMSEVHSGGLCLRFSLLETGAEMASFTHSDNLLLCKSRDFDEDSFHLHAFDRLEIDVANSFVTRFYVRVGLGAL